MKGIKCTSNEVNAILAGDKGQIRLVAKINFKSGINQRFSGLKSFKFGDEFRISGSTDEVCEPFKCPHQIGDLVFVKEDFCEKVDQETFEFLGDYHYRASCDFDVFMMGDDGFSIENKDGSERLAWKPAQYMKQHQSRITLRIKDISVERLQDISREDCLKEGSYLDRCKCLPRKNDKNPLDHVFNQHYCHIHGMEFRHTWNKTHKKPEEKFEANPFIFKIEFEVVK